MAAIAENAALAMLAATKVNRLGLCRVVLYRSEVRALMTDHRKKADFCFAHKSTSSSSYQPQLEQNRGPFCAMIGSDMIGSPLEI